LQPSCSNASASFPRETCRGCERSSCARRPCIRWRRRSASAITCKLGEGELKSGGFARPRFLADAFEALIGAVFVDGGFSAARETIRRLYEPLLANLDPKALGKDRRRFCRNCFRPERSPCLNIPWWQPRAAHSQNFEVECLIPQLSVRTTGIGSSRRNAEQEAAMRAFEQIRRSNGRTVMAVEPFRCGAIALIGRPNVGKSTLLNALLGQKLSITSHKPQTTRQSLRGVLTTGTAQFVLHRHPGFQTRYRGALNRAMTAHSGALEAVDVVALVVEAKRFGAEDRALLKQVPRGSVVPGREQDRHDRTASLLRF